MARNGRPFGHAYSNSNSVRPRTARQRHMSMERVPSDDANIPEDVSATSHVYDTQIEDEDEDEDVFAFVPRRREPQRIPGPMENGRTFSFDIPRDEQDALDEDMDSMDAFPNQSSLPHIPPTRGASRNAADAQSFSWDQYELVQPDVRIGSHGSLHRTKSASGFSDVPSTVHSVETDSLYNGVRSRPQTQLIHDADGQVLVPMHTLGKSDEGPVSRGSGEVLDLGIDPEEDSPYPEVRASVSNMDDPSMPVITFRMWFIALLLSSVGGAVNVFLSLRFPSPSLSPVLLHLLAYFFGKFLAFIMPIDEYYLPRWLGGYRFTLNPGAFNIKEHTLIAIMVNITIQQAYSINFLLASELPQFYHAPQPDVFEFIFSLSSQVIGFGLAGFLQPFLVKPAEMIWPQTLLTSTILNTLHAEEEPTDKSMTRMHWFMYSGFGAFVWNFVPNCLIAAISQMCWVCWIAKRNVKLNIVTGIYGMGLTSLTFDWTQVAYLDSPLATPWWAHVNIFSGFVVFMWILAPIMYFTNTYNVAYLPFNSGQVFDRHGQPYKPFEVVERDNFQFNEERYRNYSPIMLPVGYLLSYFAGFMSLTAVLMHGVLNHGQEIMRLLFRKSKTPDDIHAKLMRRYKQVPFWWYQWILVICLLAILIVLEYSDLAISPALVLLALAIPAVYALPSGYIFALSGQMIGTNIVSDIVGGYVLSGHPKSFLLFKTLAVQTLISCLGYTSDMKIGHYMKVPPRAVYAVQLIGALVVVCIQIGVKRLMVATVTDLCMPYQRFKLTCQSVNVYFNTSLIWGVIGPKRIFAETDYQFVLWGLLAGAVLPTLVWLVKRRYPTSWVRLVNVPVFLTDAAVLPAAASLNFTAFFAVAVLFQFYLKRHNFRWWSKYNFVTANSLEAGTIISELITFFLIQLPSNDQWTINWWGNTVMEETADFQHTPLLQPPPQGIDP